MFQWARTTWGDYKTKNKQTNNKQGPPFRLTRLSLSSSTPRTLRAKKLRMCTDLFATPRQLSSAQHDREQVRRTQAETIRPPRRVSGSQCDQRPDLHTSHRLLTMARTNLRQRTPSLERPDFLQTQTVTSPSDTTSKDQ